jgi:isopenicillin N synthase-like dioxygenase
MNALSIVDLALSGESDRASLNRIAADVGAARRAFCFFYVVNQGSRQRSSSKPSRIPVAFSDPA